MKLSFMDKQKKIGNNVKGKLAKGNVYDTPFQMS